MGRVGLNSTCNYGCLGVGQVHDDHMLEHDELGEQHEERLDDRGTTVPLDLRSHTTRRETVGPALDGREQPWMAKREGDGAGACRREHGRRYPQLYDDFALPVVGTLPDGMAAGVPEKGDICGVLRDGHLLSPVGTQVGDDFQIRCNFPDPLHQAGGIL